MEEDRVTWFYPKELNEEQVIKANEARLAFIECYKKLHAVLPPGRRSSVVWTHLEEAAHMATKAISHG